MRCLGRAAIQTYFCPSDECDDDSDEIYIYLCCKKAAAFKLGSNLTTLHGLEQIQVTLVCPCVCAFK